VKDTSTAQSARRFSEELERWPASDERKTLGGMGGVFAEKSFAVTIMLLMIVPATPLPTGGVTHVFESLHPLRARSKQRVCSFPRVAIGGVEVGLVSF
jgi:hypothetical protein